MQRLNRETGNVFLAADAAYPLANVENQGRLKIQVSERESLRRVKIQRMTTIRHFEKAARHKSLEREAERSTTEPPRL